jgi:rubrerythrin
MTRHDSDRVAAALIAFDVALADNAPTFESRIAAMRAALAAADNVRQHVAMCETCFTPWPLNSAPTVCPNCTKGAGND